MKKTLFFLITLLFCFVINAQEVDLETAIQVAQNHYLKLNPEKSGFKSGSITNLVYTAKEQRSSTTKSAGSEEVFLFFLIMEKMKVF